MELVVNMLKKAMAGTCGTQTVKKKCAADLLGETAAVITMKRTFNSCQSHLCVCRVSAVIFEHRASWFHGKRPAHTMAEASQLHRSARNQQSVASGTIGMWRTS